MATLRSLKVLSWMVSTRASSSASNTLWQVRQAVAMFRSGLRTWWSLIFSVVIWLLVANFLGE